MKANSAALLKMFLFATALMLLPSPALAAGCSDPACSGAVCCSSLEEGNKAVWDYYDGNPDATKLVMVDSGPCGSVDNHDMLLRATGEGGIERIVESMLCGMSKG